MNLDFLFPNEPTRFNESYLDSVLTHCVKNNASDITIQTSQPIIAEIYGRIFHITRRPLANTEVGDLINAIYGANGTAILLSGKDIDTHYEIRPNRTERYRFRINATACQVEGHDAIQITARTIPSDPPLLSTMDLPPIILEHLAPEDGVVYITGATGSGKSTLLASIIRDIAEKEDSNRKILTYESPIEFVYDNIESPTCIISQSEIPKHLPSFDAGVRNALRRKPRLILVGESRDYETIAAVMEAAMTGHPVYTTLHSNGVPETIRRLVNTFPAEERNARTIDIFETIRLVIWQKLVPTVDGKRLPLREYLVFDEEVRDILLDTPLDQVTAATRHLVHERGQPMLVEANRVFKEGLISERQYKILTQLAKKSEQTAIA